MNFDKKSLKKLITLSDEELINVLRDIAKEAGVDDKNLNIGKSEVSKIRTFLSLASEDDIARLLTQFGGKK
jgi:hypothetical protein